MNITLWEITVWALLAICSFYIGKTTSSNKEIWIAHEALYHLDDDEYDFNALLIYFPFLIFIAVNVFVNCLIHASIIYGISLLLKLGEVYVYAYSICMILTTTITAKKVIERIFCKRDYISSNRVANIILNIIFYACIICLIYISVRIGGVRHLIERDAYDLR